MRMTSGEMYCEEDSFHLSVRGEVFEGMSVCLQHAVKSCTQPDYDGCIVLLESRDIDSRNDGGCSSFQQLLPANASYSKHCTAS
jgi:hypothetical protein